MPIFCSLKQRYGKDFCIAECPTRGPESHFRYTRIDQPTDLPAADARTIDVAVLDMNHGWPNLGHDSLVHTLIDAACDLTETLRGAGILIRVLSFDVRRSGIVPEAPGGRFALYLGTGGPGHIDPRENDGVNDYSQGLREDPSWREPTFALFDAIRADPGSALLAVCHTFGVLCDWSGIARPTLRADDKGGKSTGVLENVATRQASEHPWFGRHWKTAGERLRILDNRLFDLIPDADRVAEAGTPIGFETLGVGGPPGDALTMFEFERDPAGVMPRMFGVNHHPEVINRARQMMILEQRVERGEVSAQWAAERREILTRVYPDEDSDHLLQRTSATTLIAPMRYHLYRQVRLRAERLGRRVDLHEDEVLEGGSTATLDARPLAAHETVGMI